MNKPRNDETVAKAAEGLVHAIERATRASEWRQSAESKYARHGTYLDEARIEERKAIEAMRAARAELVREAAR